MSAHAVSQEWLDAQRREIEAQRAQAVRTAHGDVQLDSEQWALDRYLEAREKLYKRVPRERKARLHALHPDKLGRPQTELELLEYAWLTTRTDANLRPVLRESARRKVNAKWKNADAYRTALTEHFRTLAPPPRSRWSSPLIPEAVRTPTARTSSARAPTPDAAPDPVRTPTARTPQPEVRTPTARQEKDRLRKLAARAKARALVVQPIACAVCGAPITAVRHGRRLYCSGACRAKASRQQGGRS